MHTFYDIDRMDSTLDQYGPVDPAIVRYLREDLMVRWTVHSNAILRLEELLQNNEPLTERRIKSVHQLILKGMDDDKDAYVPMVARIVTDGFRRYAHELGLQGGGKA